MKNRISDLLEIRVRGGFADGKLFKGEPIDAYAYMEDMSGQYDGFLITDMDGIETSSPDIELLQDAADNFTVLADTGIRSLEDAIDTAMTGVDRVTCDLSRLEAKIEEIAGLLENVCIKIKSTEGGEETVDWLIKSEKKVAGVLFEHEIGGWPGELLDKAASAFKKVYVLLGPAECFPPDTIPENVQIIWRNREESNRGEEETKKEEGTPDGSR